MVTISINDNIKLINKNNFEQTSFDIILLSVCIIFCFFEEHACSSESFNIFTTSIECCLLCSLLSVFSVFSKTIGDDGREFNE